MKWIVEIEVSVPEDQVFVVEDQIAEKKEEEEKGKEDGSSSTPMLMNSEMATPYFKDVLTPLVLNFDAGMSNTQDLFQLSFPEIKNKEHLK